MSIGQGSGSVQLALVMALAGSWIGGWVFPAQASPLIQSSSEQREGDRPGITPTSENTGGGTVAVQITIPRISDRAQPATTVKDWLAQIEAATVQVTAVKLERTDTGLDIVLESAEGKPLQVDATKFRTEGNSLIADIPNAVLALPQGQTFVADNPTADIAKVQVVQQDVSSIRVSVTGNTAPPTTEVTLKTGELAYSLNSEADEPDEEIVVTGEQDGYRVPNSSIGTRTDTPLRDSPQSIQVVPQQVLEDQQVNTFNEALQNVPGVIQAFPNYTQFNGFTIRGFNVTDNSGNYLRNGLTYRFGSVGTNFSNIERIEVLRGPASVLFGQGSPGGTINVVTRQPLSDPFYSVEASIGSYDFYRGAIDLSGPLNDSRTALYRLTASYENAGSFIDFINRDNPSVAGVLRFDISDSTTLILDAEYNKINQIYYGGIPAIGTVLPNINGEIPRNRNPGDPDGIYTPEIIRVGYNLEHRFSENWLLRNAFYYSHNSFRNRNSYFIRSLDPDQRTIQRGIQDSDDNFEAFDLFTNVVGNFSTGSIQHQLLLGIDLNRFDYYESEYEGRVGTPLDLFNPNYSSERFDVLFTGDEDNLTDSLGVYIQDQVRLTDNLILLLGGRFDAFEQTRRDFLNDTEQSQSGDAFSPRVGIVYQPIPPISLYASYSRSFTPTIGRSITGEQFAPGRGTQYEIGVKADINDNLSATLALYDLTRSNVLTADPDNPGFSVQTGEQNSRGVELNIAGEILPGWNIIAGYAYTDARVTKDNAIEIGNRLNNVPEHSFSLWTSYELQEGDLQGLGFGLGLFFIGDRQGDLANTFSLPSYLRTDAAIFYKRGQFRAALNIRNLFNIEYFEAATSRLRVYPAEPFTIQGTLSWEF